MKAVIKKLLKRLLEICRAHTSAAEVAIGAEKPGLCWHLAEAPSAWQGLWLQGTEVLGEEPADHICGKEPGSCRVPFSNTVQTQGLSGKETEVSHSMVHRRAHWKFLHLIIKVLKDMALFQNQKCIHCEIPTLAKISPDISEWSFADIFTEVCSFLTGKNLTPLFNHVTPHFHWLSLFPFP